MLTADSQADIPQHKRLVMSKMILENFKSYAGHREIGPFHKSFTSIVGPNGSGKSNVIDALLFVFGFKAKKMRQGKLSELIHHSSDFPNLQFCQVSVHFQEIIDSSADVNEYHIVPNSEIIISRYVEKTEKGDKSIYKINNRASNFTEVTTLLKDKGVDLDHKRFLILQGEVESISQMKPKAQNEHEDGLLEYLEDIIGTAHYKAQIEEIGKQLEEVNEERSSKLGRVRLVEKEKNNMQGQKDEAENFLKAENDLVIKKNQLLQLSIFECARQNDILNDTITMMKQEMVQAKAGSKDSEKEVEELKSKTKALEKEYEVIAEKAEAARKELQKFERVEVEFKEKEKHLKQKQKKLAKAIHGEQLSKSEDELWMKHHSVDLEKFDHEITDLTSKLQKEEKELETIRESLKGKTEVYQKQVEDKQVELAPWTDKISKLESSIAVAQSEYDLLKEKVFGSQIALQDAEERLRTLEISKAEKEQELKTKQAELNESSNSLNKDKSELSLLDEEEEKMKKIVQGSRQKADDAKLALQSGQMRGSVHKAILQQASGGKIKGVCGRLGDLGTIDDKYDIAVTTACSALDSIVVETVDAGQKCIDFLRQRNLGRANFICLDKLGKKDTTKISTPENAPRLFDLIKPKEPRFAQAFFYGLNNTLVAENLDQANRIAYGKTRFRVVTLDGQLIDISGTMSGGGMKPQKGGMSSKIASDEVTEETVLKLERKRNEAEETLKELVQLKKELSDALFGKKQVLSKAELEISKIEMDIKAIDQQIEDCNKTIKEIKNESRSYDAESTRMKQLEKEMHAKQKEIESLKQDSSKIEEEIKELQEKILEIGGVRFRSQKSKVDNIQERIDLANKNITSIQCEKSTRERNLNKISKSIEKKEKEMNEIEIELEQIEQKANESRECAGNIRDKVKEAKDSLDDKEEELNARKKELEEKIQSCNELRSKELELRAKLDDSQKKIAANTASMSTYTKDISSLKLHKIGFEENEDPLELEEYAEHELKAFDKDALRHDIKKLESELNKAKPNLGVLAEYKAKMDEYLKKSSELEECTNRRDELKQKYDDLRKNRLEEFMSGFTVISQKLKEMYQMITLGGNAELELVDSLDPFSEGIVFSVMPPKKSWKNISNLSGGEKTLSSLALVFALHHYKPTPLYVMDEIDAALDFRNVSIVANYIKERTKNAQFVIISLRNNMFELSNYLVGIYKTNNTTKSVTIDPNALARCTGLLCE